MTPRCLTPVLWALVKPVTVNIRDGQNRTTITEASRICHVAIMSRMFNENLGLASVRHGLIGSLSARVFETRTATGREHFAR